MARCRCAEGGCICALVAGRNTTVHGVGNPTDPWVVDVAPSSTGTITFNDGPSVDFTQTGSGTESDPTLVRARAVIAALVDLVSSGDLTITETGAGTEGDPVVFSLSFTSIATAGGTLGDVLTLGADGKYAPGPPSQVAPGTIFTGGGLTGDGTVADPIRLSVCTYAQLKMMCN